MRVLRTMVLSSCSSSTTGSRRARGEERGLYDWGRWGRCGSGDGAGSEKRVVFIDMDIEEKERREDKLLQCVVRHLRYAFFRPCLPYIDNVVITHRSGITRSSYIRLSYPARNNSHIPLPAVLPLPHSQQPPQSP